MPNVRMMIEALKPQNYDSGKTERLQKTVAPSYEPACSDCFINLKRFEPPS